MLTPARMGSEAWIILTRIEHRSKRLLDVDKNESDDEQGDNADLHGAARE